MGTVQHISMRVPWRDQPWDDKVCHSPLDNSSCLLLRHIGGRRDDDWESEVAGRSFAELPYQRLPCLTERATWRRSTHTASTAGSADTSSRRPSPCRRTPSSPCLSGG